MKLLKRSPRRWITALALIVVAFGIIAGNHLMQPDSAQQLWTTTNSPVKVAGAASYDDGNVKLTIGSSRTYGYRIGAPIYVEIQVAARPGVQLSFETLQAQVITRGNTDFEMVAPPVITSSVQNGVTVWKIQMLVRFWTNHDPAPFVAEFLYSDLTISDQPVWQYAETPPVQFAYSATAPQGAKDIQQGPLNDLPQSTHYLGWLVLVLGVLLALVSPLLLLRLWWRKRHTPRPLTDEEMFWATVDKLAAGTTYTGWREEHYQLIAAAYRKYLKRETATRQELEFTFQDHPQLGSILNAEGKFDTELYSRHPLREADNELLFAELDKVIPRHPAQSATPRRRLPVRIWRRICSGPRWIWRRLRRKA